MEEEILKGTDEEQSTVNDEGLQGDDFSLPQNSVEKLAVNITSGQLTEICEKLENSWKKLATKLGYNDSEIQFFESENETPALQGANMLQVWFEDDPDATLENLCYILEGLHLNDVADLIKNVYLSSS